MHAKPHTILGLRQGILTIASALKRRPPRDETVKAWEASLLCYITAASYSERTKHSTFSKSTQVLAEVARFRREVYRRAINPFSKKSTTGTPYVEPQVLERALSIARREALSVVQRFKNPPAEYKPFLAGLRDLANRRGGYLPSLSTHLERRPELARQTHNVFQRALRKGISGPDLRRLVHPTLQDLLPFFILLLYAFAANVESVSHLRRDKIDRYMNPITGERMLITLDKPRAGGEIPPYQVGIGGTLSVSWLIESVTLLTERVAQNAPKQRRSYLFLALNQNRVSMMTNPARNVVFRRWLKEHRLPDMLLSALRPTRAIEDYKKHRDADRSRALLRQKSISTTLLYLDHTIAHETDDQIIARAQASMLSGTPMNPSKRKDRSKGSGGVVLPTHRCADPENPHVPHDESGLCVNVIWPLNDRHFVMPLEPRPVAFLLRDYDALREAQLRLPAARFARYATKMLYIEKNYLPLIADELREAATLLIPTLPKAPILD